MKGVFSAPGDYVYFKSQVALHKIPIGSKLWRYYDFGPKVVPPLICLPGTAGTADVYYKQIMALSIKGYRVISIDIPRVWNHHEWVQAFEKFLDAIDVHHVHLYGTSLGGFLAQLFAQHRPRRVKSLILSNTFLETSTFAASMPWAPVVGWTPSFLLKRYILTGIRDGPHEPFIADSVDFVVSQVEKLSRDDLASRLALNADAASVGPIQISDSLITLMDTNDYCAIPQQLKDQVSERYPGARRAYLKSGGDFPFLSRPDEVNLHLQLHLRRVGVEARPDLVQNTPKDGASGSSSEQNDGRGDSDDVRKEDKRDAETSSNTSEPPLLPESTDSSYLENQLLNIAKLLDTSAENLRRLLHAFSVQEHYPVTSDVLPSKSEAGAENLRRLLHAFSVQEHDPVTSDVLPSKSEAASAIDCITLHLSTVYINPELCLKSRHILQQVREY